MLNNCTIKKVDFHTHTNISDGVYSPEQLIDFSIAQNLIALAITDHDSVGGLERAVKYAAEKNFNFIPGIEFSLGYSGGSFHLVGLYIDYNNERLHDTVKHLQEFRFDRARRMVEELNSHGINISFDDVRAEMQGTSIGKPHIANVMIKKGYAADMSDVFTNFMTQGKPGYVKKENIPVSEVVSVIKEAGGIPIIAHPASLRFTSQKQFEDMIKNLIDIGVQGIEVYSSMHQMNEVFQFYKIARKFNLLISGGSDFHGDKKEDLGAYSEGKYIPLEIFDDIETFRRKNANIKGLNQLRT